MKRNHVFAVLFLLLPGIAGCGDSWNSLNQMEKNVQNEIADLLSRVQDEASAKLAVLDATERIKNKWEGVKKRKDKYIKSQFLGPLQDRIDKVKQAKPGLTTKQAIEELKTGEQALKTDQINEILTRLMLANEEDHNKEVSKTWERIDRELARIRSLPEEPPEEGAPQKGPIGPPGKSGGSYLKQALEIPKNVLGQK